MDQQRSLINIFARHKVAANLLMAVMILAGIFALNRLNTQFMPTYDLDIIRITVVWPGASAEDIERSITTPLETDLRNVDHIKKMLSTSRLGASTIVIEFDQGSDMGHALEQVREKVSQLRNLPPDSEKPIITKVEAFEPVARLVVSGPENLDELRPLVRRMERELLDKGIAKITITGLPDQEMAIQIPINRLNEINKSLNQIALIIAARSKDVPAGTVGKKTLGRQLRSLGQRRDVKSFEQLPLVTDEQGQLLRLGDIAKIQLRPMDDETVVSYKGKPAVQMTLLRTASANALTSAEVLKNYLKQIKPELGSSVHLHVYNEHWILIKERINLLLKNGSQGLLLILIILFIFLNARVAFWVAMGIPASFMAALAVLYVAGNSINMVSMFAFIMTLGIIVDDTIVVGEEALTNFTHHKSGLISVEKAAHKMLAPIMASSLTTIFAFLPLMLISGIIGSIIFTIPLVVICVIIASLVECFLVLPGHLHHSFKSPKALVESKFRLKFNTHFERFRSRTFKSIITYAIRNRWTTLATAVGLFVVCLGLVLGGYLKFNFFPAPEGRLIYANVQFTAGTPPQKIKQFLAHLNQSLDKTRKQFKDNGQDIVETAVTFQNQSVATADWQINRGEQYGSLAVELMSTEKRDVTNKDFIDAWRKNITVPPGVENFTIIMPRGGPPGKDIDVKISGNNATVLKQAALEIKNALNTYPGVSDIQDDMPFAQEQLIYDLTPTGKALGLTISSVGRQLRAAFNGEIVQIYHEPNEEIEVRVMLPDEQRDNIASLDQLPIVTPGNEAVPLGTVLKLNYHRSPDVLKHTNTKLTVHVTAEVDAKTGNANQVLASLNNNIVPKVEKQFSVKTEFEGKAEEQRDTFRDIGYGLMLGVVLIYITLAWVFASYGWPLVVMTAIPLGLTGAVIGHLIMGIDLTILSMFGFFGLSGIVVNDSIILLNEFKNIRANGISEQRAIISASVKRLRAVILTSLTTIAGLTPLLFERSLQAQFLIPMAVSIAFGLAYATVLILLVVPALLSVHESSHKLLVAWRHSRSTK